MVKYKINKFIENFYITLSYMLPRQLTMWCFIRIVAYATTGKYSSTVVTELSVTDALKRWDDTNN